jgi:hypothetical protein
MQINECGKNYVPFKSFVDYRWSGLPLFPFSRLFCMIVSIANLCDLWPSHCKLMCIIDIAAHSYICKLSQTLVPDLWSFARLHLWRHVNYVLLLLYVGFLFITVMDTFGVDHDMGDQLATKHLILEKTLM